MKLLTVNEALDERDALKGRRVLVEGVLSWELENTALYHWPKAERLPGKWSSLWLEEDPESVFRFHAKKLESWSGKRVVVTGVLRVNPEYEGIGALGFGHFGLWTGQVVPTMIELRKRWLRSHSMKSGMG